MGVNFSTDSNTLPYTLGVCGKVIGVVSVNQTLLKFYIAVRGILISVPKDEDIVGTIDLLYKLYKIFNIEPAGLTKAFIDFLDYFIYDNEDISSAKITKEMHDLGDKLKSLSV
ncbi:uncharacterized protein LOC116351316 [Contarinia nasturtii]|uniref:uncharacterized protein LOC116351316 n=1 Tax=Contarinia nasturtii TaxID=265458 RepID=UPI0012D3C123|nr:uncharacterized protein LOC116351316 [Contarinia nasturtii]